MILPLQKCPGRRIIGSTHNVWQEVFYRDREEVGGEVCQGRGLGGCNRGNHVKPHCYYSSEEVHKGWDTVFFVAKQTLFISLATSTGVSAPCSVLKVKGGGCGCTWHTFPSVHPIPEPRGWGHRGKKIRCWAGVGDVSLISGKMLLLPSGPAVLFPAERWNCSN